MSTLERGRVASGGAGGFLNPPGHPEHHWHVETDLRRRPENRGSMSLSYAVDCEYLDQATRNSAARTLGSWERPPLESPEVQDWIRHVLGYFKGCYRGSGSEPQCWHASTLRILKRGETAPPVEEHAGVRLIRTFYPEFAPSEAHFSEAYWGTKP